MLNGTQREDIHRKSLKLPVWEGQDVGLWRGRYVHPPKKMLISCHTGDSKSILEKISA